MGDRINLKLEYSSGQPIYFYSHWMGDSMPRVLAKALNRGKERWDDDSYLARIIFSELVREDIDGLTGYGIAPYETDPQNPTIVVNLKAHTVNDLSYAH